MYLGKRNITDVEIALIKAMLARGMKNKDIQFYFNRPERAVNSGRITGIANGAYSDSATIPAMSDEALEAFLTTPTLTASSGPALALDPLDAVRLKAMFAKDAEGFWRLAAGESDEHECKAAYGAKYRGKWLRAVAALANNRGGYLFFGVHDKDAEKVDGHDKSYELIGLATTEFTDADPKDIFRYIKAVFDPTPRVRFGYGEIDGRHFGVIYVDPVQSKPVIARQSEGNGEIREGDIFFRYPGSSERIKYSDLRTIMDQRDLEVRSRILPMVERLLAIGPDKALVADLEAGLLTDGAQSIVIDESLVAKLQFIREGEFSEVDGAPALRLLGDVSTVESHKSSDVFGALTESAFFAEFLAGKVPGNPADFLRWAVEGGHANWLPIFWLARLAKLDRTALAEFIGKCEAPSARRRTFQKRAAGTASAYLEPKGPVAEMCKQMKGATPVSPQTPSEAARICQAIFGLTELPAAPEPLFTVLGQCQELSRSSSPTMSHFRRAVCRLDELLFAKCTQYPHDAVSARRLTTI